jgi:hypothetical protein
VNRHAGSNQRYFPPFDIKEAMTVGENDFTVGDVQRVFQKWMRGVTCIIENGGESTLE